VVEPRRLLRKGVRGELNPPPRLSQSRVPAVTPQTPSSRTAEGAGVEPARALLLNRLPTGPRHPSGGPTVSVVPGGIEPPRFPMSKGRPAAGPRDCRAAPRPGVEPGTSRSKREMISVSPPGCREWTSRESNPHLRHARPASSRWTRGPFLAVETTGIEPDQAACEAASPPWYMRPRCVRQGDRETRRQGDKEKWRNAAFLYCFPCLPVSLSPCLPVSLSPCLPVSLSPCLLVSLSPCLLVSFACRPLTARTHQ
jgi:hypothetical protein